MSTENLEILKVHKEMIERDSKEISKIWKILPMCFSFISAVCGYGCSLLFYIFWRDIFGGNCPIWAKLEPPLHLRFLRDMGSEIIEGGPETETDDWRKKLIISFKNNFHCEFYFFVTLCSCLFGVVWLMLFSRCGKGGYDTRIFTAPWRIVPPALLFHLIFAPIVIGVVHDFAYGYWSFTKNLKRAAFTYVNSTQMAEFTKPCEIVRYYLQIYDINRYNICYVYKAIQVLSWTMAWCWLLTCGILFLRVIAVADFRYLIITIYKIPKKISNDSKRNISFDIIDEKIENPVKKQRIKKIYFVVPEQQKN